MPYLNRALAEEQLGVESQAPKVAQMHYQNAIRVRMEYVSVCLLGPAGCW